MTYISNVAKNTSRMSVGVGIAVIIFGILAILAPLFAGMSINVLLAVLLIASGIAKSIYAFKANTVGKGILQFLFGGLTIICGILLFVFPMLGLSSITLLLIIYFLVDGTLTVISGFQTKPNKGWGWMLLNGLITISLGVMLAVDWPISGAWAIGTLLGVRLLMSGLSMMVLGWAGEKLVDEVER